MLQLLYKLYFHGRVGGWVGGRLDQAEIKLTSVPAELKLELELSLAISLS